MANEQKLDVSKWYAARRQFLYTPVLWFYHRMIVAAVLDAHSKVETEPLSGKQKPSDEALLARDWIARSEDAPAMADHKFVSFPECCRMLSLDPEVERPALLALIDQAVDTDNDEAWARLEELSAREPADDVEPLFDAPRIVPALDQAVLF